MPDANSRLSTRQVDVADIEADELCQAEAGAEGEGDEESLSGAILDRLKERRLVASGQRRRAELGHRGFVGREDCRWLMGRFSLESEARSSLHDDAPESALRD